MRRARELEIGAWIPCVVVTVNANDMDSPYHVDREFGSYKIHVGEAPNFMTVDFVKETLLRIPEVRHMRGQQGVGGCCLVS